MLDLYAGVWDDHPLHPDDGILRAEEKTSIQARRRCPPSRPPRPGPPLQGEHEYEYEREGALAYLAAWDGRRGRIQGRWEATSGKAPFGRLGDQVRPPEPSRSAPRVFWSVARGSRHRGAKSARALAAR